MTGLQKRAATAFIVAFVALGIVDATPVISPSHARLKSRVDPFLDATGLWQGDWRLFAPMPRKINIYVSARVISDGVAVDWHSPRWTEMGLIEKFFHVRHMKFYDAIRLDENRGAWEAFAEYRRRQLPSSIRDSVERIELRRHWRDTAPPRESWVPAGENPGPDQSYTFFTKEMR